MSSTWYNAGQWNIHCDVCGFRFKANEIREGFTPAQRFFIAYAQLWKIKYTDEEMKNRIANDPHSPGMYRVNGPLKNCPEFFEAFDVKEGRVMRNDAKKIAKIW